MGSGSPLKNLFSLTEPLGPPSPEAPLSETSTISVLSSCAGLLQVVEQPADLVVGVAQEAGVDLRHPREQALLVVGRESPRANGVGLRPGLVPSALFSSMYGLIGDSSACREDPQLLLALEHQLPVGLVAHVELALVLVGPLLRRVVRSVARAGQ